MCYLVVERKVHPVRMRLNEEVKTGTSGRSWNKGACLDSPAIRWKIVQVLRGARQCVCSRIISVGRGGVRRGPEGGLSCMADRDSAQGVCRDRSGGDRDVRDSNLLGVGDDVAHRGASSRQLDVPVDGGRNVRSRDAFRSSQIVGHQDKYHNQDDRNRRHDPTSSPPSGLHATRIVNGSVTTNTFVRTDSETRGLGLPRASQLATPNPETAENRVGESTVNLTGPVWPAFVPSRVILIDAKSAFRLPALHRRHA